MSEKLEDKIRKAVPELQDDPNPLQRFDIDFEDSTDLSDVDEMNDEYHEVTQHAEKVSKEVYDTIVSQSYKRKYEKYLAKTKADICAHVENDPDYTVSFDEKERTVTYVFRY